MKNLLGSLIIAFSMYSRIPMPQIAWTKERMKYAMCFFPLTGLAAGICLLGLSLLCSVYPLTETGRACLGTALPLVITGGIHMDGFLDVTDALSSCQPKERKLEILKDPHTGAFAIIGCGVYLLLYAAGFAQLSAKGVPAFSGTFLLTRALSGLAVVFFPKAKNTGLAAAFSGQAQRAATGGAMTVCIFVSAAWMASVGGMVYAALALLLSVFILGAYVRMAVREFGGITGDLAGWFLQSAELALLWLSALAV